MKMSQVSSGPVNWWPNFCSLAGAFVLSISAEVVLLIILLAPHIPSTLTWNKFLIGTVFVQWLVGLCILAWCRLRHFMMQHSVLVGVSVALLWVALIVSMGSALVYSLNLVFHWEWIATPAIFHFVWRNTAIALLVAVSGIRYFYIRAKWQHSVQAHAQAQLVALQARIQPHFLFNCLNTIASLIPSRPQDAETAVEDLADLFRVSFSEQNHLVPLREELRIVDSYLALEKLRLGERLRIHIDIPEEIKDFKIPVLTLQPIVENAILHGIQNLPQGGEVALMCLSITTHHFQICVRNPLIQKNDIEITNIYHGNGMAQRNIQHRLQYYYAEEAVFQIHQDKTFYDVLLTIPKQYKRS